MAQLVKTVGGLAIGSVKTIKGLAIGSVKSIGGLDNTGGGYDPGADASVVNWLKDGQAGSDGDHINWTAATGPNADNATSGDRAILKKAILNGKDIMRFTGTEWLQTTAYGAALTQPYSIAVVFKYDDETFHSGCLLCDRTVRVDINHLGSNDTFCVYANGADNVGFAASSAGWHRVIVEYNGASTKAKYDGGTDTTLAASPGTANFDGLTVGRFEVAAQFWIGDIAEIIVRSGQFADKAAVDSYLATRWGL